MTELAPIVINQTPSHYPDGGLNKYELLQSGSAEVRTLYQQFFQKNGGSLTTVSDNDTIQKMKVAMANLQPNPIQSTILESFESAFTDIEMSIDPSRLQFTITKAMDEEICINRKSDKGISTLIINYDGVVIFSFIAYTGINELDVFEAFDDGIEDFESLSYKFFSL